LAILKDKNKRQNIREVLYEELDSIGVPIPETIKKLRKILKMNQTAFAEYTEISLSALRRIEQEQQTYKISTLLKILEKFNFRLVVKK